MGKLKKIKLKEFFEMNDVAMKNVVGGYLNIGGECFLYCQDGSIAMQIPTCFGVDSFEHAKLCASHSGLPASVDQYCKCRK